MLISEVVELFRRAGARQVICKALAPNDNSKNQVYVAGSLDILNVLPMAVIREERSENGTPVLKASLDFYWLSSSGNREKAPHAQLILYPQYPEVRLSGFLRGTMHAPNRILASRDPERVLFLGVSDNDEILAFASVEPALVSEVKAKGVDEHYGAFKSVWGGLALGTRQLLVDRLTEISKLGWVQAQKLSADGLIGPCRGSNCGGYTLEALMGITPNGRSEPDFEGWELKTHTVSGFDRPPSGQLTLMTPEPTAGLYRSEGASWFVRTYGYSDTNIADRLNFSSPHRIDERNARTGLTLRLDGYRDGRVDNPLGALVLLDDADNAAAAWPFAGILAHWNKKHAQAAYVPNVCRGKPDTSYQFGSEWRLGEGTDFTRFLQAVSAGQVFYDPGIKLENASTTQARLKRRNQFRIRSKDLGALYASFTSVAAT